jgi:type II secretory pathway component PulF
MAFEALLAPIDHAIIRLQFVTNVCIEFYETLSMLSENRILLEDALKQMFYIAEGTRRPGHVSQKLYSRILQACMLGMAKGDSLSTVLSQWTNRQELTLVAAGEKSGRLIESLAQAIVLIQAKQQIKKSCADRKSLSNGVS